MGDKVRIYELAKELDVDAKRVLDVLQTMNVDVKNHMSTIDDKTAEKVTDAVKGSKPRKADGAAQGRPAAKEKKEEKAEVKTPPAREANPARASLLDLYFGGDAGKASTKSADAGTRPRPAATERPARPASAERPVPAAERAAGRPRPAADALPEAEARARRSPRPGSQAEVHTEPLVQASPQPLPEATPAAAAKPEVASHVTAAPAPAAEVPVQVPAPALDTAPVENQLKSKVEEGAVGELQLTLPRKIEQPGAQEPRSDAAARPDAPRPKITIGLPTPPRPQLDGSRPQLDGPRPAGMGAPRPAMPGPRPAGAAPAPGAGPSIGLPRKLAPGEAPSRPAFGPRPGGAGGFGGKEGGPGIGGPSRGPRPGGGGPGRPGFGNRGGGGGLVIPKVDPKLAAQQPEQRRSPLGQGGDRRKGDAFSKRENAASRPAEEKLFGRRPQRGMAARVERRSLKPITIEAAMTVKELAAAMGITAGEVIKKLLTDLGVMATINQELDTDTCVLIGDAFGVEVTVKEPEFQETYDEVIEVEEAPELLKPRWPVVTVMGHVDHGKTSLLDAIRSARVAAGEAGGITQHIGAYTVEQNGKRITFLDTPGHEAFTAMRARGANVTDIAVLVVAADDSVMPQTIESINHAKAADVPIVVAVNKIDKPGANPDKVKQDLTQHGLVVEEWGGETIAVPVSAKQRIGIDNLLETILLVAEVQDLKANPEKDAAGTVLEAELDKGKGPIATVLIQSGTLQLGDSFVAGQAFGKVRAMFDDKGKKLKKAGPSVPVQILGFNAVPSAGDIFRVVPDEKTAREVAEKRQNAERAAMQATTKVTLEDLMNRSAGEMKDLNLVIKGDVQGSVEAIRGAVEQLRNEEVQIKVVHYGVGAITESDVMLAAASKAIIYGFNVRPDDRAARAASEQGVDIRLHRVIYDIVDELKAAMTGMLKPKFEEVVLGKAEVRATFKVPKAGTVAGSMVLEGKIVRSAKVRLLRDGVVVWEGNIDSLKRFKDDAREVATGFECGIGLERFNDVREGDIIEAFEIKEIKPGEQA